MSGSPKRAPGALTKEIADILNGWMTRKHFVQSQIASDVGISPSQLSKILNGHKPIDIELLEDICESVGRTLMDVVTEAEEATSQRRLTR